MKKNTITFNDFIKLDIRVGEIKSAEKIEGSDKLLKLQVDLGKDYGIVQILSGIAKKYKPEKLIGKKFPFIANLEPRKMFGQDSNGMIMAIDLDDKPILIPLRKTVPDGTIIR